MSFTPQLTLTTKQTLSLFIFTTLILSQTLVSADCNYGTCEPPSQRLQRHSRTLSEASDMDINPGITKELQIHLKGKSEEISVSFNAEEADFTKFTVSILSNQQPTSSLNAYFPERETLKITLNYDSKQCNLIGSQGFSLSMPIKDSSYEISVEKNKASQVILEDGYDLIRVTSHENLNSSFGLIVTIGICVLAMLGVRMFITAKKSKNLLIEELDETNNSQDSSKRADNEAAMNSKPLTKNQDIISPEKKENKSFVKEFNFVIDNGAFNRTLETNQAKLDNSKETTRKTDTNTILSTAQTLSNLPNQRMIGIGSFSNLKSIHEECGFSINGGDTPKTESHHHHRHREHGGSIVLESPLTSPNENKVFAFPHKKHQEIGMDLALSMDMFERDGSVVPTITAIKDLVSKMKEDGTIGIDNDPSVDSDDDEDQYEAPQLPNYTCCMLCFQGTRCTIVEPCRHVFACVDCVEELLDSYKICVLCANQISEYGMLGDE